MTLHFTVRGQDAPRLKTSKKLPESLFENVIVASLAGTAVSLRKVLPRKLSLKKLHSVVSKWQCWEKFPLNL